MREIKFRGKRIDNGEWVYGDLIENQGRFFIYHATSETTLIDDNDRDITVISIAVDNNTVGQFTGLHDCKGREIYEGDIYRSDLTGINYLIKWNPTHAMFIAKSTNSADCYCIDNGWFYNKMYVGIIHDNPELVKGGEQ